MRVRVWSAAATLSSPLVVQVTQERSHLAFQLPLTLRDQYAAYFSCKAHSYDCGKSSSVSYSAALSPCERNAF